MGCVCFLVVWCVFACVCAVQLCWGVLYVDHCVMLSNVCLLNMLFLCVCVSAFSLMCLCAVVVIYRVVSYGVCVLVFVCVCVFVCVVFNAFMRLCVN